MEIDTTRFGKILAKESELIGMRGHILGFERHTRFVLLTYEDTTPFSWMQSIDDPGTAFVVINPRIVKPDFAPAIPEDELDLLDIQTAKETALLAIVTLRSDPFRATANLRAPILINTTKRWAKQIILDDAGYPIRYDILGNMVEMKRGLSEEERMEGDQTGGFRPSSTAAD